jgi:hypothetical protein
MISIQYLHSGKVSASQDSHSQPCRGAGANPSTSSAKARPFMRPSSGRFLKAMPIDSSSAHDAYTSSTVTAMWPKPRRGSTLPAPTAETGAKLGPNWSESTIHTTVVNDIRSFSAVVVQQGQRGVWQRKQCRVRLGGARLSSPIAIRERGQEIMALCGVVKLVHERHLEHIRVKSQRLHGVLHAQLCVIEKRHGRNLQSFQKQFLLQYSVAAAG